MRVGFGETGVDLLRIAMSWLFGCFRSRKERSHQRSKHGQFFASARQALSKVASRRDKAQVLPDSGVENDEKRKSREAEVLIKTPDEFRVHDDTSQTSAVAVAREEHNYETPATPHASEETPAFLSVPFDASIHGPDTRDDYLSIDSVFPASLLSDGSSRLEENTEDDDFSICKPAPRSVSKSDSEARTSQSSETRSSQLSFDEKPIMGLVATDWPESDSEVKSFKAWDGKGIPNSTTKIKLSASRQYRLKHG